MLNLSAAVPVHNWLNNFTHREHVWYLSLLLLWPQSIGHPDCSSGIIPMVVHKLGAHAADILTTA